MAYIYRNGIEYYLPKLAVGHNHPVMAKPRKFGKLCNMKRRD